ncbi:hypothetical protein ACWEL8_14965 [Streptomyces sp. NPDC004690]
MGTRGGPRFRAVVLGSRLAPVLLAGVLSGVLSAGCAGPAATGPGGAPSPTPPAHPASGRSPAPPSPSPRVTSPAELCARAVAYWARKVLDDDTYGDYQSMGLSNTQYEILRRVVAAARPIRQGQGTDAVQHLIDRQARTECAERYRDGASGKGPWQ